MVTQDTVKARKIPKQARSIATVEAILEATAQLLAADGYDKMSTNKVAKRAGVSVGSLYQYFPSKEALARALLDQHVADVMQTLADHSVNALRGNLEDQVRGFVGAMFAAHSENAALHRILFTQVPRMLGMDFLSEIHQPLEKMLRTALVARGDELPHLSPEHTPVVLMHAVQGVIHGALFESPEVFSNPDFFEEVVQMILRYLKPALKKEEHHADH